jgi:calcineurin-like phosphoesterase family protein
LHFWHKNVSKYCNRPFEAVEEMNQSIINNWNSVVKEYDDVFVLADSRFNSDGRRFGRCVRY